MADPTRRLAQNACTRGDHAEVLADRGADQDAAPGLRRKVETLLNVYI